MVPGVFKYMWYRVLGQPGSWRVQPYDFCDAENADGISKSSHKNGIYSLTRNVKGICQRLDELIKSR